MENFNIKLMGERLKELRLEKGIGQNQLAKHLGVSNASISYWETAKQEPTANAIYKIAKFFHTSCDYLLGLTEF